MLLLQKAAVVMPSTIIFLPDQLNLVNFTHPELFLYLNCISLPHKIPAGYIPAPSPSQCWQLCTLAGLAPASRSCNIISYWFLVDLPWSSHHSVMCSTRLLNEINITLPNTSPIGLSGNSVNYRRSARNICELKFWLSWFVINLSWNKIKAYVHGPACSQQIFSCVSPVTHHNWAWKKKKKNKAKEWTLPAFTELTDSTDYD